MTTCSRRHSVRAVLTEDDVAGSVPLDLPAGHALPEVARVWQDVAKNEETRFSNINTRALGVLTIGGVVTSVAGFFAKDLLTGPAALHGWVRGTAAALLIVAVLALLAGTALAVVGVLLPKKRPAFGKNDIVDKPATLSGVEAVHMILVREYSAIALGLQARNEEKARELHKAYIAVLIAVVAITGGAVLTASDVIVN